MVEIAELLHSNGIFRDGIADPVTRRWHREELGKTGMKASISFPTRSSN